MKTTTKIFNWVTIIFVFFSIIYIFILAYKQNNFSIDISVFIALYLLMLITGVFIFAQRRQTLAKISWLFIIIIIPFFGPIFFLFFGCKYKWRLSREEYFKKYMKTFNNQHLVSKKYISTLMKKQSKLSKKIVSDAHIHVFSNGMESFTKLFKDLSNAKKFIHLNYYIIKPSEIWEEFKNVIIKKAQEGIEIKIIMDDFGIWSLPGYELKNLTKKGIQLAIYNKVRFPFITSQDGFRSHRKYSVIDGQIAYTGGVNISDEYVGYSSSYGMWEDSVIKIEGNGVQAYSHLFINDWMNIMNTELSLSKYAPNPIPKGEDRIILVEDSHELDFPLIQSSLIQLIFLSKKSIEITTPYLVPTPELFLALRTASLSGVKVKIFIPGLADKKLVLQESLSNAIALSKFGIEIKTINGKFLHTKAAIFDGKTAYLGTVNLDFRSMYSQLENIALFEGPSVVQMKQMFKKYDYDSIKLNLNNKKFPLKIKLKSIALRLFAPIM